MMLGVAACASPKEEAEAPPASEPHSGGAAPAEAAPEGEAAPGGPATCSPGLLPDFPWPVPSPSTRMAISRALLAQTAAMPEPRLKHAANELDALLVAAGYSERSYFRLQDDHQTLGFALVTRMERIKKDGTPFPPDERFLPAGAPDQFDVLSFLKSLFVAPVGYYRVLVFVVARAPVKADGEAITEETAQQWLATGGTRLLGCVAEMPFTDAYAVDALIYEFRHAPEEAVDDPDQRVSQLTPSKLAPALHLRRAGILAPPPR